jgi:hypothetical protein
VISAFNFWRNFSIFGQRNWENFDFQSVNSTSLVFLVVKICQIFDTLSNNFPSSNRIEKYCQLLDTSFARMDWLQRKST